MKMHKVLPSLLLLVVMSLFLFSKSAQALPVYMNNRPLDGLAANLLHDGIDDQELGGPGGVFDTIGAYSCGDNPYDTQSSSAIFKTIPNPGDVTIPWGTFSTIGNSIANFIITQATAPSYGTAGIYRYNDGPTPQLIPLFSGTQNSDAFEEATIYFLPNGDVMIEGTGGSVLSPTVISAYYTGFGYEFGFYYDYYDWQNPTDNRTFYSQDILNPYENPQALIYQGNNIDSLSLPGVMGSSLFTDSKWIIAFEEDEYAQSDKDFNDFVFIVESIEPIPEPSTYLLLLMGLIGMVGIKKKFS